MKVMKTYSLLALLALMMTACGGGTDTAENGLTHVADSKNATDDKANKFQTEKVNNIFYSVPSPIEMASLLKGSGSKYNANLLNDISNRDKYTSSYIKAINLGVYGADLSYTSAFNRNQESILYMSSAKQLADELGVSAAFDQDVLNRIEENIDNRDSLLSIISETFYILDAYLKENDRSSVSAQVISGGWIEGLYIAAKVYEDDEEKSEKLVGRIVDQKYALDDLIALVTSYNGKNDLNEILKDLKTLQTLFAKAKEVDVEPSKNTSGKVVLGTSKKLTMTEKDMLVLVKKLKEIREKYVSA